MIALHAKGGRAILDFGAMELGDNNQGIRLTGSYWHVYGLDICNRRRQQVCSSNATSPQAATTTLSRVRPKRDTTT